MDVLVPSGVSHTYIQQVSVHQLRSFTLGVQHISGCLETNRHICDGR